MSIRIAVYKRQTLRIMNNGLMTYTTTAGSKGLALEGLGAGQVTAADILTEGAKLPIGVLNAISSGEGTKLYLSGFEEKGESYIVTFDYMHNGCLLYTSPFNRHGNHDSHCSRKQQDQHKRRIGFLCREGPGERRLDGRIVYKCKKQEIEHQA